MNDMLLEEEPLEVTVPQKRSILIVEDDESLAEVLAMRLASQGFATIMANSGALGQALAKSEQPDLILLDVRLPDADGLKLCEQLVDDPETAGAPVIIVSGMERPDIVRRARAAGCQYFVRKPYDPNALLILIEHALKDQQ
jgi:two-component system cell cycle response regulator DivK